MLLAVSDAVVTGTAAVLGALVGVAAGGVVDALLEARRERARAKAGARLLAVELNMAAIVFKFAADNAIWHPQQQVEMVAWPEYRDALALRLTNDQFSSVSSAVTGIIYIMEGWKGMQEQKPGKAAPLSPATVKEIRDGRTRLRDAYNVLAEVGGLRRVEGPLLPVEKEGQTEPPSNP